MFFTKSWEVYRRTTNAAWVTAFPWIPLKTIACKVEPVQDLAAAWLEGMSWLDIRQIFTRDMDMLTWDKIVIDWITYQVQHPKPRIGLMTSYIILYCNISAWT